MSDIVKYYIDNDKFNMNYYPDALYNYERSTRNGEKMYIVKTDNKKYELTREMYIKLMKDFGKKMGYAPIKLTIIQENVY